MSATTVTTNRGDARSRFPREAARSRRRLYPSTVLYTSYSLTLLFIALGTPQWPLALMFYAAGIAAWTLMEYGAHRYILHGRFPEGRGPIRWLMHKYFDPLHWEHHARPWDGDHINGTLRDTLVVAGVLAGASVFFPMATGPVMVAGMLQAYILEEWIHHSVHFYHFRNRYFRYIRAHHLFHHSPKGFDVGYGLTSGFWDVVWRTRIPEADRRALYAQRRATLRTLRPPVTAPSDGTAAAEPPGA